MLFIAKEVEKYYERVFCQVQSEDYSRVGF